MKIKIKIKVKSCYFNVITLMTYLAKRAEFIHFQNWKNNTAHRVMVVKNTGSTTNSSDLEKTKHHAGKVIYVTRHTLHELQSIPKAVTSTTQAKINQVNKKSKCSWKDHPSSIHPKESRKEGILLGECHKLEANGMIAMLDTSS